MARARLRWLADESQNSQRESALEIVSYADALRSHGITESNMHGKERKRGTPTKQLTSKPL